jgi:histidinol-phosphate aminotransferase
MDFNWNDWIPGRIKEGKAYIPGEQKNTRDWIKLNTNEFPFSPSPQVEEAIAAASRDLRFYPEPTGRILREKLAKKHTVSPDSVVLFNGCDDALNSCIRGLVDPGERVAYLNPSYSLYTTLLKNHGAVGVAVDYLSEFDFPLAELISCDAKMFVLTSPNAPSGRAFERSEMLKLLESKKAIFVVDETYGDFSDWSAIEDIQDYPNLIVVRSFSKTYGLAGLRIGYAIADSGVVPTLHQIRDVYNVNRLSQAGATAALRDPGYYSEKHRILMDTKKAFAAFVRAELGWNAIPSATNFLFFYPTSATGCTGADVAQSLFSFLVEKRVLVRYFSNHPLVESGLRVSIGTPEEMETVKNLLKQWALRE